MPLSHRIFAFAVIAITTAAVARPKITVSINQAKEVVETAGDGKKTSRLVPTQNASPGDVLEYVLTYRNEGDSAATNAVIEDPIPKGTTFLANSAAGEGAEITFSSDGGKTFAPPVRLTYEFRSSDGRVERRVATPAEYTHIRWTVKQVPPGATGKVSFRVRVN